MINNSTHQGLITGLLAYTMWGLFPLFFHQLRSVSSWDVLMHRVIWSFWFVLVMMFLLKRQHQITEALRNPENLKKLTLSALLVSSNWLVFIWAVAQGRVVESSLGYFITPLVSVFLARIFLREVLNRWQQVAIILAILGLAWLVYKLGYLPWVSLFLAISFGCYGLIRKQVAVDSMTGFSVETALLLPIAILYWPLMNMIGESKEFFPDQASIILLLLLSGAITSAPLILFAFAAKRLTLSAIGFMMYINPSLQFLIALYVLGEPFNLDQLIGFIFIWCALIVYTIGSIRGSRKSLLAI